MTRVKIKPSAIPFVAMAVAVAMASTMHLAASSVVEYKCVAFVADSSILFLTSYPGKNIPRFLLDIQYHGRHRDRLENLNSFSVLRQIIGSAIIDNVITSIPVIKSNPTTPNNAEFRIREARYSDLGQVAELTTDAFFFFSNTKKNPIMRAIRYLLELDRLQNNFPYHNNDTTSEKHAYLVSTSIENDAKVIGFCDIDGRKPKAKNNVFRTELGLSTKKTTTATVQRPCPYFSDLVVHPSYRRRGVASRLASEAEFRAKQDWTYDELYLCIRLDDDVILRMYNDRGYELVEPSTMTQDMIDFLSVQEGKMLMRRTL